MFGTVYSLLILTAAAFSFGNYACKQLIKGEGARFAFFFIAGYALGGLFGTALIFSITETQ